MCKCVPNNKFLLLHISYKSNTNDSDGDGDDGYEDDSHLHLNSLVAS